MFLAGEVLNILDKELQDSENDDTDSSRHHNIETMNASVILLMKNARTNTVHFL